MNLIKFIFFISFFCFSATFHAQSNLVPNGDFEEYHTCPGLNGHYLYTTCDNWTSPTAASPDYCNACCQEYNQLFQTLTYSVPQNSFGYQPAQSGNGYSLIGCQQNTDGSGMYMEYIQVELKETLKAGIIYEVRFFVHNPKLDCINNVGALFTPSELNLNTQEIIPLEPQVSSDPDIFFCDTTKWYEVKQFYHAVGDEKFLSIGVFKKFPELKMIHINGWVPDIPTFWGILYIDNISVSENLELANIFTPNKDGVNDTYELDLARMNAKKAVIMNRWGNKIVEEETFLKWDGSFQGTDCPDGVYFIKLELEDRTMTGTIQLIR